MFRIERLYSRMVRDHEHEWFVYIDHPAVCIIIALLFSNLLLSFTYCCYALQIWGSSLPTQWDWAPILNREASNCDYVAVLPLRLVYSNCAHVAMSVRASIALVRLAGWFVFTSCYLLDPLIVHQYIESSFMNVYFFVMVHNSLWAL